MSSIRCRLSVLVSEHTEAHRNASGEETITNSMEITYVDNVRFDTRPESRMNDQFLDVFTHAHTPKDTQSIRQTILISYPRHIVRRTHRRRDQRKQTSGMWRVRETMCHFDRLSKQRRARSQ